MKKEKNIKKRARKEKKETSGQVFIGCVILGVAIGALFEHIWIGTLFGIGIGFIIKSVLEPRN
ncbi:hypothetical protein GW932_03340 [archaeon]|nr:hypothetical protein [archaeon]